jgi:single-stranded DNA-binding protein
MVANFTLAVRQNKKDAPARWVKVAVWGKPAEYVGNYVKKGDSVLCVGRVEAPELFTRRDGSQGLAEVFTAENIEKWGERQAQQGQAPAQQPAPTQNAYAQASQPAAPRPAPHPAHEAAGWQSSARPADHDDIPF